MKTIRQFERVWRDKGAIGMDWDYPAQLPALAKAVGLPLRIVKTMIIVGRIPVRQVFDGELCDVIRSEDVVEGLRNLCRDRRRPELRICKGRNRLTERHAKEIRKSRHDGN